MALLSWKGKLVNKICIILIGYPASGKTTFRNELLTYHTAKAQEAYPAWTGLSSDDYIQKIADLRKQTYAETFAGTIKKAEEVVMAQLKFAVDYKDDVIIFDRTNLTKRSRAKVIDLIIDRSHDSYLFAAFDFSCKVVDWDKRLKSRPGKEIPEIVLTRMQNTYEPADPEEGFTHIEYVNTSAPYDIGEYYRQIEELRGRK